MREGIPEDWLVALDELKWTKEVVPRGFERWVACGMRRSRNPSTRFRFASLAPWCSDTRVISSLIQGAKDINEHFLVRGTCLEMLAHRGSSSKRATRQERKIANVVMGGLRAPHPNIRFWACFAAAGLRLFSAQDILRGLLQDEGLGDLGWTVGYEAGEALKELRGQPAWVESRVGMKSPYPCPLSLG